ncbi:S8 family peptidase [Nonomuraea lactucae]|uniref:S8 family peptidase n=1 Tax=Nonomuraea lactucae TaxID=2249762 RepID=UPI0013B41391|nr:S8 family peptidase [Nonomuraea lactucae]
MKRKAGLTALVAVTALGSVAAPAAGVGAVNSMAAQRQDAALQVAPALQGGASGQVTLITGDRVTLYGTPGDKQAYRIHPGSGRKVSFAAQRRDGHLHVIPSDAAPLIAQGLVDQRFFDVTQLLAWQYDDAHRADIPVITEGATAPGAATAQQRRIDTLGLSAARVTKAQAGTAWARLGQGAGRRTLGASVSKLWLDGKRKLFLDKSVPQIGAPKAWEQGLTGKGVTVAVIDSGYDPDHPDLKDVVTQSVNFSDEPDATDTNGHGTHVASTIAGSGQASGGKYRGVAPDAKLAIAKVGGQSGDISDSALIAGMEWAATKAKARVANVSIGGPDHQDLDPIEQAVNTLSQQTGTLFVIAAGNSPGKGTMNSPGSADAALTVGAVDSADQLASFSSQGPRKGDGAVKPDITAPGVEIVAAAAKGTADGPYRPESGTSMATPHVAGAAAILAQKHPDWTGEQLKAALMSGAKPKEGLSPYQQGAGRVDVPGALAQQVVATPANVWAVVRWPGGGEPPTKKITYRNTAEAPVTLALSAEGPFTLSAERLEVPAKGEAAVTLTLRGGLQTGTHPGMVTAASGDMTVRTLAGAFVEPESYDLTVTALGRDGAPAKMPMITAYDLKNARFESIDMQEGTGKVRLPRGDYSLVAHIADQSGPTTTHFKVRIGTRDEKVVLDARKAVPVRFTVDDPTAAPAEIAKVSLRYKEGDKVIEFMYWPFADPRDTYVFPSRQRGLEFMAATVWNKKDASPSPYRYDLVDYRSGGIPADPGVRARTANLTKITSSFRGQHVAAKGDFDRGPALRGSDLIFLGSSPTPVDLPGTLTSYLTPARGLIWRSGLSIGPPDEARHDVEDAKDVTFGGRPVTEIWNAAVTGPAAPVLRRRGDEMSYVPSGLFTDTGLDRAGWDGNAKGSVVLAKDGTVLAKAELDGCANWWYCPLVATGLPAETGTYTLTASARRDVPYAALSTAVEATWTFRSARTTESQPLALPALRYAPEGLDAFNRAKTGSATEVQMRAEGGQLETPRVEASFDDGRTWQPLELRRTAKGWTTSITNPAAPGFVSLRATASGPDGQEVKQTITRAYAVTT